MLASENLVANDLWKYDGTYWTWISGNALTLKPYGIVNSNPGGRYGAAAWTDDEDNLWMFGGIGYSSNGAYITTN